MRSLPCKTYWWGGIKENVEKLWGGHYSLKREGRTYEILQKAYKSLQDHPKWFLQLLTGKVYYAQMDLALTSVPSKKKAALQIHLLHQISFYFHSALDSLREDWWFTVLRERTKETKKKEKTNSLKNLCYWWFTFSTLYSFAAAVPCDLLGFSAFSLLLDLLWKRCNLKDSFAEGILWYNHWENKWKTRFCFRLSIWWNENWLKTPNGFEVIRRRHRKVEWVRLHDYNSPHRHMGALAHSKYNHNQHIC